MVQHEREREHATLVLRDTPSLSGALRWPGQKDEAAIC